MQNKGKGAKICAVRDQLHGGGWNLGVGAPVTTEKCVWGGGAGGV